MSPPGAPLGHLTLCVVPWSNGAMAAGEAVALAAGSTAAASVLAPCDQHRAPMKGTKVICLGRALF